MIAVFQYIKRWHMEDGARLFSAAPEDGIQSSGPRLQEKLIQVNIWKKVPDSKSSSTVEPNSLGN